MARYSRETPWIKSVLSMAEAPLSQFGVIECMSEQEIIPSCSIGR